MKILKFENILLILILFGALFVRLYKIDNPVADWHSWRQADTASVTRFFVKDGINFLYPRYHDISSTATGYENPRGYRFVEFPIFNWFHAVLYETFPFWPLERWGRLTSIFASLVSTFFIFLLGRRFLGSWGGLLAASFFAFLPFNIYYSRVILPEPMAAAFGVSALWFFVRWIDGAPQYSWNIFASTLFFTAALLLKPFTVFYGIPMLYLATQRFGIFGMVKEAKLWMFFGLSLIPLFAWRAWIADVTRLVGIPHWVWVFNGDLIRFKPSFWHWIFGERLGQLILGIWNVIPFAFGLIYRSKNFPWFVQAAVFGQLLYVTIIATANVRHDYYQTLTIPAISLSLAAGTLYLWRLKEFLARAMLVASIVLGLALSAFLVKEFYKINHPEIIKAGAAVGRLTPPGALVIAPYNGDTAFLYQTGRIGWPHVTLPIEEMISKLGSEYYVSVNFDKQTLEVMGSYKVLEKTDDYVVVHLVKK